MLKVFSRLYKGKLDIQIRDVHVKVTSSGIDHLLFVHDRLCLHVDPSSGEVCGKPTMGDGAQGFMCRYHYYRHNLSRNRPATSEDRDQIEFMLGQDHKAIIEGGLAPFTWYGRFANEHPSIAPPADDLDDDEIS